jgi:nucleoside-diphosphate-sugar epimerase
VPIEPAEVERGRTAEPAVTPSRVFITGALGFIGRALAERFRAAGAEVGGVDRAADPGLDVVAGDIAVPGPWQRAAAGADLVVHTAALLGFPRETTEFWPVNVRGTRLALDAAREGGASRFVHLSSIVVFGLDFPDGVDEGHPVRPIGEAYVDTKIASEQVVLQAHAAGEVAATVLRPGDVYGPGSRPWTVWPVELLRARRFLLPAMGRGIHSPVFVDDLVEGIVRAAHAPAAAGRVITLSGGTGVPTREFFAHYTRMLGLGDPPVAPTAVALAGAAAVDALARARRVPNELTPAAVRYLADRRGTYSIAAAADLLGWRPVVGVAEGMERCEAWLRSEGLLG